MSVWGRAGLMILLSIRDLTALCSCTCDSLTVWVSDLRSSSFLMWHLRFPWCPCINSPTDCHRTSRSSVISVGDGIPVRFSLSLIYPLRYISTPLSASDRRCSHCLHDPSMSFTATTVPVHSEVSLCLHLIHGPIQHDLINLPKCLHWNREEICSD